MLLQYTNTSFLMFLLKDYLPAENDTFSTLFFGSFLIVNGRTKFFTFIILHSS